MNKTTVIYHNADFDGIFCREIARQRVPEAEFIGWNYGEPEPVVPTGHRLFILDLSVPTLMAHPNLVWIDHHKSAIERYSPMIAGFQTDGVAACRLTWQWFYPSGPAWRPTREEFVKRQVPEPLAVRLAGEYDVWDKRDPRAETFQFGLRSEELGPVTWSSLLSSDEIEVERLLSRGAVIQDYQRRQDETMARTRTFDVEWEGMRFLAINAVRCNSNTFAAAAKPEHDGLMGFYWNGKEWTVSLYGAPGHPEHDLSKIAARFGGGGHRGACGFRCAKLPFLEM